MVKRLGPMNYLAKVGDQAKKVHVDHLMAAHRDSSSRAAADDWKILPFRSPVATPQIDIDVSSDNTNVPIETGPASRRYPQRDRRPVKRFELIEFCK